MATKGLIRLVGVATCVAVMVAGWDAEAGWRRRHGSSGGATKATKVTEESTTVYVATVASSSYTGCGSTGGSYSYGSYGSTGGSYSYGSHGSTGGSYSYGSHGSTGGSYSYGSHGSTGGSYSYGSHGSHGSHGSTGYAVVHHHSVAAASVDSATILVELPKDAKVFLNGEETKITGPSRQFVCKSLKADASYEYTVKIVTADSALEQTKVVKLSRGSRETVKFDPATATAVKPAAAKPDAVATTGG